MARDPASEFGKAHGASSRRRRCARGVRAARGALVASSKATANDPAFLNRLMQRSRRRRPRGARAANV